MQTHAGGELRNSQNKRMRRDPYITPYVFPTQGESARRRGRSAVEPPSIRRTADEPCLLACLQSSSSLTGTGKRLLAEQVSRKPQRTKLKYTWRPMRFSTTDPVNFVQKNTPSDETSCESAIGPLFPSRNGVRFWASGRRPRALLKLHIANVSYFKAANDRLPASHRLSSHREAEHA